MFMKKIAITTILFLTFFSLKAQLTISIKTSIPFTDTLILCPNIETYFYAYAINSLGDTIHNATFSWDFDNGDKYEDLDLDTINYKYKTDGFYRILIKVWTATDTGYAILPVKLGLNPDMTETKADIPAGQNGICDGETVTLIGSAKPIIYTEERPSVKTETFPVYIDNIHNYTSSIIIRNFGHDTLINSADDIDSIAVKMEHSKSTTVQISIICPNGQKAILKDFGGNDHYLGEPITLPDNYNPGVGYWYWFSMNSTAGILNNYSVTQIIPSNVYQPQQSFNSLIGCPLNGEWSLQVIDSANDSNDGYVWAWALYFDKKKETDTIKYSNTYLLNNSVWSGDGINLTSNGVGQATPEGKGTHIYNFLVKDNFGCWHDTTINVLVEKPLIVLEKENMYIGDSTRFADSTSWSKEWSWNFGDNSDIFTEKYGYKKYADSGTYNIILTATAQSGCKDYDTAKIVISPHPIDITKYNIFTPNEDGTNDVFNFFNTPDEKIIAENIGQISGGVYDRNGVVVCQWNSQEEIKKGWDGTYNNNGIRKLPSGYYFYVLKIKGKDGINYPPFYGTIYLYR